ncbi:MAG: omptin family outer membrane protease [Desulfobulbaceae bacterium]|nr:omptin family outer membrane protease [Desulfobulbaceae bacterium]
MEEATIEIIVASGQQQQTSLFIVHDEPLIQPCANQFMEGDQMQHRNTFTKLAFTLGAFLAAATSQNADASPQSGITLDIAAGAERWSGDTTYQIGGKFADAMTGESGTLHFPISELEWPLDVWMAGIDLGLHLGNSFTINGALKKNVSDPDDPMKDSDWAIAYIDGLPVDVYSESDITSFDAAIYDINAEWTIARPGITAISIGVGHMKQEFEYEASLNFQEAYIPVYGTYRITGDDRTAITYDITYKMTYFLVGFDVQFGPATKMETQFAYSPLTDAEDEDHHLLRENGGKISKGEMDDNDKAYMLEVSFRHDFTPMLFVEAGAHFTKIEVEGIQAQVYGIGEPIGIIEEKTESNQLSEFLRIGIAL